MKRVNIHLDEEWTKALDVICNRIKNITSVGYSAYGLTRADLIRFAVAQTFGFEFEYTHVGKETIADAIKKLKIIKK